MVLERERERERERSRQQERTLSHRGAIRSPPARTHTFARSLARLGLPPSSLPSFLSREAVYLSVCEGVLVLVIWPSLVVSDIMAYERTSLFARSYALSNAPACCLASCALCSTPYAMPLPTPPAGTSAYVRRRSNYGPLSLSDLSAAVHQTTTTTSCTLAPRRCRHLLPPTTASTTTASTTSSPTLHLRCRCPRRLMLSTTTTTTTTIMQLVRRRRCRCRHQPTRTMTTTTPTSTPARCRRSRRRLATTASSIPL